MGLKTSGYLTDTEIMSWNDRLKKLRYPSSDMFYIRASSSSLSRYNTIEFIEQPIGNVNPWSRKESYLKRVYDFNYDIIFSIPNDKDELFTKIFNRIKIDEYQNYVVIEDNSRMLDMEKFIKINFTKTKHSLFNKDYIRYEYNLSGHLAEIMGYVKTIDDTIEFLKIKPKYNIDQVVSTKDDKSLDYIILEYFYHKEHNKYEINYVLREIIIENDIVNYGIKTIFSEEKLCNSRTNIITNLVKE